MSSVPTQFAAQLRRLREEAGLSQEQLAFRADLHPNAVGLLERGEREPLLGTVLVLARALDVPIARLVEGIVVPEA